MALRLPETTDIFTERYHAEVSISEKRYYRPVSVNFSGLGMPDGPDHLNMDSEYGIKVTIPQHEFAKLVEDAELGREVKRLRSNNPALLAAWDQYRMVLALTARMDGSDLP